MVKRSQHKQSAWPGLAWLAILVVAVTVRLWRLPWGLREGGWFPDEMIFARRAVQFVPFSMASFRVPDFLYPSLYGYLGGVATALDHVPMLLRGGPGPTAPDVILALRAVSMAAGVATVIIVGRTAARMYSSRAGFAAAALMAVAPFHAMHSHIAATDVTLTAFFALATFAAYELACRQTIASAALAGMTAGLGFATKYTGLAALAPIFWAVIEGVIQRRVGAPTSLSTRSGRAAVLVLAVLGGFGAAVALGCPTCVLDAGGMLEALRFHATNQVVFSNNSLVPSLGWYGRPYLYEIFASLPYALGWPLDVLSVVGVGVALWRNKVADRVVLATVLPYFLVIGYGRVVFPRYLLPLFPGLIVLCGRAVAELPGTRRSATVLAAVGLYSLSLTVSHVARFSSDQQQAMAEWIAARARSEGARPGSLRVAVAARIPSMMRFDYYRLNRPFARAGVNYVAAGERYWLEPVFDVLIIPEWLAIEVRRDRPGSAAARALDRLESGAAGYHLAERWTSSYLQRDFYTHLDPAFAGDLWQGEIGFAAFVREAASD